MKIDVTSLAVFLVHSPTLASTFLGLGDVGRVLSEDSRPVDVLMSSS